MADSNDITPAHIRALDHVMDFGHVVRVFPNGNVNPVLDIMAPECFVRTDSDGSIVLGGEEELAVMLDNQGGWKLMVGYSNAQGQGHSGIMHSSEYIGGGMARDILTNPGVYVALDVVCRTPDMTDTEDSAGWSVAYRHDA